LPDNVVGRLTRHAKPPREVRRPYRVGWWKAEDREMGRLQVREPRGLEVRFDSGPHMLEALPQQRADVSGVKTFYTREAVMQSAVADIIGIGGLELRFLVDETQGSGDLVIFEMTVHPNARVPVPHYHRGVDEVIYGLSGTLTGRINGEAHEIRAGDCPRIPRGAVHYSENVHEETARALIVLNPGSIGRAYFEEIAKAVSGPGKPDPARLKEIMLRYGLVPA
jgi:quercetin dioxygenase-like cupin family protein